MLHVGHVTRQSRIFDPRDKVGRPCHSINKNIETYASSYGIIVTMRKPPMKENSVESMN